jgi:hypothetical protein
MRVAACVTGLLLVAGPAVAQDRPNEDDMFGGAGRGTAADSATATATATGTSTEGKASDTHTVPGQAVRTATSSATGTDTSTSTGGPPAQTGANAPVDERDFLNLNDPRASTRLSSEVAPEDPLRIGGQFYWRAMSTARQGQEPQNWSMSTPALLDVYMDARPNDRVRAFVLGRMSYDPTLPQNGTVAGTSAGSLQNSDALSAMFAQRTRGPSVALDQMWLRFDVMRTVFVTAGKQHVRWGTARFWTPTDYMHTQARNPLLPFDPRVGTTMLKLHVPWEERGWNFYAYALPESPAATSRTGDVAAAARAEIVLGAFETGLGVFGQRNSKAKFAGDVSFGLWDLDFYGEAALRSAADVDFVGFRRATFAPNPDGTFTSDTNPPVIVDPTQWRNSSQYGAQLVPSLVDAYFPVHRGSGWKPQVTGGVSYTRQYADKDTFTVGAEYFYNALGYDDPTVYPGVVFLPHGTALRNPASFFYLGRHYAAVFATAPAPYSWDNTTFTFSNLMNISDKSGITRLDYSLVLLTHLRFEAYAAVHWGQRNGEFRFGIDGSVLGSGVNAVEDISQQISTPPAVLDLGLGLRVAI